MVKLTKIYTRGGDTGETSLVDGSRRPKDDLRIGTFGTIDEANALLGLARRETEGDTDAMLARIQHDLFDLGADLATPKGKEDEKNLRITEGQVKRLEGEIDAMNAELEPLTSFVLPGGSEASAILHYARAVIRRAERLIVALAREEEINPAALKYVNRLSDHIFVLARRLNDNGRRDVLWEPGLNRAQET